MTHPKMTRGQRLALYVAVVLLGMAAAVAGSYYLAIQAIHSSQQVLCEIIDLTTGPSAPPRPPNPQASPALQRQYEFYQAAKDVSRRYDCMHTSPLPAPRPSR